MILVAFAALLVVPLATGYAEPRWVRATIVAGVAPAAVWWIAAYHDNPDLHSGERIFVTGVFAVLYLLVWAGCAVLGATLARLTRRSAPPR